MTVGKYDALAAKCLHEAKMGACVVVLLGVENGAGNGNFGIALADIRVAPAFATLLRSIADGFSKVAKGATKKKRKAKRRKKS